MKHGDKIKRKILDAGLALWRQEPRAVTLRNVAKRLNLTHPAISYHFKEDGLRDAVAAHAVEVGDSRIIMQLMAQGHVAVRGLTEQQRRRHALAVSG